MPKLVIPHGHIGIPLSERLKMLGELLATHHPALRFPARDDAPNNADLGLIATMLSMHVGSFYSSGRRPSPLLIQLQEIVSSIGLMPKEQFLKIVGSPSALSVATTRPDDHVVGINAWGQKLAAAGLKVPCQNVMKPSPFFTLIAWDVKLDRRRLAKKGGASLNAITQLADKLGYMAFDEYITAYGSTFRESAPSDGGTACLEMVGPLVAFDLKASSENAALAESMLRHLHKNYISQNLPLPEDIRNGRRPAYRKLYRDAGIPWNGYANDTILIPLIDVAACLVGYGLSAEKPRLAEFENYAQLHWAGKYICMLRYGDLEPSNMAAFKSALTTFMAAAQRTGSDPIGDDFGVMYDHISDLRLTQLAKHDTRYRWKVQMAEWRSVFELSQFKATNVLSEDFGAALGQLRRMSKFANIRDLCRAAGCEEFYRVVKTWVLDGVRPDPQDVAIIQGLENALGVRANTLVTRLTTKTVEKFSKNLPVSERPPSLQDQTLWRKLKQALPANFKSLSMDEKEAIGSQLREAYYRTTKYREKHRELNKQHWCEKHLPERFQRQWDVYVEHKTTEYPSIERANSWRSATVKMYERVCKEIWSVVKLPMAAGGLEISEEDFSLVHLVVPQVRDCYVNFLKNRNGGKITNSIKKLLALSSGLTRKGTNGKNGRDDYVGILGYLHHLRASERAIDPILNALEGATIDEWQDNIAWSKFLNVCNSDNYRFDKNLKGKIKRSRDPLEAIDPILSADRPLDALHHLLECGYRALPPKDALSPVERAIAVRRYVSILILIRTALRRKNVMQLTFDPAGTGKFRRIDGRWTLVIPGEEFKNREGAHFYVNENEYSEYRFEMFDEDAEVLDEYINECRQILLGDKPDCGALFLTKDGTALAETALTDDMYAETFRWLVCHEEGGTGIKGVVRFAPHAVRAITATHVLKITDGNYTIAAYSIADTESMIRNHYSKYLAVDKTSVARKILLADYNRYKDSRRGGKAT